MALVTIGKVFNIVNAYKIIVKIKYDNDDNDDNFHLHIYLSYFDEVDEEVEYLKNLKSVSFEGFSNNIKSIKVRNYKITDEENKYLKKMLL